MGEPTERIKLRARQIQRFDAHKPPLPNRKLITPDVLRKANFIQPNYRLSECEVGEEDFPPQWAGSKGEDSISKTLQSKGWKNAAWNHVLGMIDESDKIIARRGVGLSCPAALEMLTEGAESPPNPRGSECTGGCP